MIQWHPLFAHLLRPLVESHYDVQTNVPVGDAPRQADIVLLRRTSQGPLPFQGLWKDLTTWNVLEFKGPTVSPRVRDLDLLVELGLGIDRRLNEERQKQRQRPLEPQEVSIWYLANRLGRRFVREAQERFGHLEPGGNGIWRCQVLRRLVFLVSNVELPVDLDSLPLHAVGEEPLETELAVARFVVAQPSLWSLYSPVLAQFHGAAWEEVRNMARTRRSEYIDVKALFEAGMKIDLKPVIEEVGLQRVIEEVGLQAVIKEVGLQAVIKEVGLPAVIKEVGLPAVIKEVGLPAVIDQIGKKNLLKELGIDDLLAELPETARKKLEKRLR